MTILEEGSTNLSQNTRVPKKIILLAGEASGDILGAGLIRALKKRYPQCEFEGIGGKLMIAEGFQSLYPMERLSVMGLVEPLKRLPELLGILKSLKQRYRETPPDIFIGIDSPDFNLRLELALRSYGIPTVHYVSPSVWAWRQGRIKKIKRAVDLMLTLFPFEHAFYEQHQVDVEFIGHPLADDIAPLTNKPNEAESQRSLAIKDLALPEEKRYLALLPGSRKFEVENLLPEFLGALALLRDRGFRHHVLIPAANQSRLDQINALLRETPIEELSVIDGQSHAVMAAADAVAMASGTTALEAMLLKKPMVICYRVARLSYYIFSKLVKVKFIGLPNLLAGKGLVPELIQSDMSAEALAEKLEVYLKDTEDRRELIDEFNRIHISLKKNASEAAASTIENRWELWSKAKC